MLRGSGRDLIRGLKANSVETEHAPRRGQPEIPVRALLNVEDSAQFAVRRPRRMVKVPQFLSAASGSRSSQRVQGTSRAGNDERALSSRSHNCRINSIANVNRDSMKLGEIICTARPTIGVV